MSELKNSEYYKSFFIEIDKERALLKVSTVFEYGKMKSIKFSFGDKNEII